MATQSEYGLFGPTPEQVAQMERQRIADEAMAFGQLDPNAQASAAMYRAGAMLTGPVMGMFGYTHKPTDQARQRQEVARGVDINTPEGLMEAARRFNELGMPQEARAAADRARQLRLELNKRNNEDLLNKAKIDYYSSRGEPKSPEALRWIEVLENPDKYSKDRVDYARKWLDSDIAKRQGKPGRNFGEPYLLGGKWVHQDLNTGEIKPIADEPSLRSDKGGKGGKSDAADGKPDALALANESFSAIERNIDKLYNRQTGRLHPDASPLFGKFDQYRPELAMSQSTVDAKAALDSLTDQVMMSNLADAKARVGQSFGSMQVQEWSKFVNQLTSLKRGLSPTAAAEALRYVLNYIQTKRDVLTKALGSDSPVPASTASTPGSAPRVPRTVSKGDQANKDADVLFVLTHELEKAIAEGRTADAADIRKEIANLRKRGVTVTTPSVSAPTPMVVQPVAPPPPSPSTYSRPQTAPRQFRIIP